MRFALTDRIARFLLQRTTIQDATGARVTLGRGRGGGARRGHIYEHGEPDSGHLGVPACASTGAAVPPARRRPGDSGDRPRWRARCLGGRAAVGARPARLEVRDPAHDLRPSRRHASPAAGHLRRVARRLDDGRASTSELEALLRNESAALDLERGPVLRAALATLPSSERALVLTAPAVCLDGASMTTAARRARAAVRAETPSSKSRCSTPTTPSGDASFSTTRGPMRRQPGRGGGRTTVAALRSFSSDARPARRGRSAHAPAVHALRRGRRSDPRCRRDACASRTRSSSKPACTRSCRASRARASSCWQGSSTGATSPTWPARSGRSPSTFRSAPGSSRQRRSRSSSTRCGGRVRTRRAGRTTPPRSSCHSARARRSASPRTTTRVEGDLYPAGGVLGLTTSTAPLALEFVVHSHGDRSSWELGYDPSCYDAADADRIARCFSTLVLGGRRRLGPGGRGSPDPRSDRARRGSRAVRWRARRRSPATAVHHAFEAHAAAAPGTLAVDGRIGAVDLRRAQRRREPARAQAGEARRGPGPDRGSVLRPLAGRSRRAARNPQVRRGVPAAQLRASGVAARAPARRGAGLRPGHPGAVALAPAAVRRPGRLSRP